MPDLKPIQTAYKGHHFRSRLEARWAVFFDALGVKYEYEAEGYDLFGFWYLPDFWLPDVGVYVEIKPAPGGDIHAVDGFHEDAQRLAIVSKHRVLVIYGNPWSGEYAISTHARKEFFWGTMSIFTGAKHPEEIWLVGDHGAFCLNPGTSDHDTPDLSAARVLDAFQAARSARFEHGESGRTL